MGEAIGPGALEVWTIHHLIFGYGDDVSMISFDS